MPAWCSFYIPVEFGGERTAAYAGAIGLGDAQDVMQEAWPDTRTSGRIASDAIAGSYKRVSAMIDIEQGALCAFK